MRALVAAAILATASLITARDVVASQPSLRISCGAPAAHHIVTCRLSGADFYPRESVRVVYRLTIDSGPHRGAGARPAASHRTTKYTRRAATGPAGSFRRPPLRFSVGPNGYAYHLTVIASGARGDQANVSASDIAD